MREKEKNNKNEEKSESEKGRKKYLWFFADILESL